jgi:signal transduction histidine kinase
MNLLFRNKKVLLLTGLMVIVSFLIAIISILVIYNNAQNSIYDRLRDVVNREKSAISVFVDNYQASEKEIINHLGLVRKNDVSLGKSGEIAIVKIENDSVRLLISDTLKNPNFRLLKNVPDITPMYLSLRGKSGLLKGMDSNGVKVFAAYTFVEALNWGIIAKIPVSEINTPFIKASILVLILSAVLISICTYAFLKITNPLIDSIIENDEKLIITNRDLNDKIEDLTLAREMLEEKEKRLLLKKEKIEAINKELKQTNERLYSAKEKAAESENQLKELTATKDKLFSIIAHDLRSPFNSIIGYSDLLIETARDYSVAESKEFIGIINSSAKYTLNLLDNLLNWTKSQTGQIIFKPEKINLTAVILEIVKISLSAAKIKNISLHYVQSSEVDVYADKYMLQVVLRNLISNAINFTNRNGKIEIHTNKEHDSVEITVSDNGIGMNENTLKNLFVTDVHTKVGDANKGHGSGLGLKLCKEFVEKNGGKIRAISTEGIGSDFKFTIPLYKS